MAKKETRETIAPYRCVQALELFNERLYGYRMAFEHLLEYAERTPGENKPYQDQVIKVAKEKQALINEFYGD